MGDSERSLPVILSILAVVSLLLLSISHPDHTQVSGAPPPRANEIIEPITPTGYSWTREMGGEVEEVIATPEGRVYALTETGLLVFLDHAGNEIWRRYYDNVEDLSMHLFPNRNLLVLSDRVEIIMYNGSVVEHHFEIGPYSRLEMRAFNDLSIIWEDTRTIHAIDMAGELKWSFELNPLTMRGIGNESGQYNYGSYEIRKDMKRLENGDILAVLYDEPHASWDTEPSVMVRFDGAGGMVSWFELDDNPLNYFEILSDSSLIFTEREEETDQWYAVRIGFDGNIIWRTAIPDYSSKAVLEDENRIVYFRSLAFYRGDNFIFTLDLDGNIIHEKEDLPSTLTDMVVIDDRIFMADLGNGSGGKLSCFDHDIELLWEREMPEGISSNIFADDEGYIYILANGTNLQKWSPEGEKLLESRIWLVDNLYLNSHMESLLDQEIGFVWIDSKIDVDRNGSIYLGLMRLYKVSSGGNLQWSRAFDGVIRSSPLPGLENDIIMGGMDGYLRSFDIEGNPRWSVETGSSISDPPLLNVSGDGYLICGTMGWVRFVLPDGSFKWSYKLNGSVYTPIIQDRSGNIYAFTWEGFVFSIGPDGKLNWTLELDRTVSADPAIIEQNRIHLFEWGDLLIIDTLNRTYSVREYGEDNRFKDGPFPLRNGQMLGINDTLVWMETDGTPIQQAKDIEYLWYSEIVEGPNGSIYIGTTTGYVFCVLPNGSTKWKIDICDDNARPVFFGDALIVAHDGLSRLDPENGEIIWNFQMGKRTYMQGYSWNLPCVLPDGSIIFAYDRLYRFTDKEILGQVKSPGISVELDGSDLGWDLDIPESGMFLSGFRVYKNDTEGNMALYMELPYHENRLEEYLVNNRSLIYEYRVEWFDHLGNAGASTVINNSREEIEVPDSARPRNLTLEYHDGRVHLAWQHPLNNEEDPVYYYHIYKYADGEWGYHDTIYGYETEYFDEDVETYETYWYYVMAETEENHVRGERGSVYAVDPVPAGFLLLFPLLPLFIIILFMAVTWFIVRRRNNEPIWYDRQGSEIKVGGFE